MRKDTFARLSFSTISVALLCALGHAQSTWYVDVHGTPPGVGTPAQPYTSIQYAVTRPTTAVNDIVVVAPGLYVDNVQRFDPVHIVASGGPLVTELRPQNPAVATVLLFYGSITGFTLTGNASSNLNGGALNLEGTIASRCIVRNNPGLGVFSYTCDLRNCTIIDNGLGIVVECFAGLSMRNTIVWGNPIIEGCMPTSTSYSAGIFPGGTSGTGNLAGDPGLWTIAGSRYFLRAGSPCIDAGDPNSPLDPDGSRADIGAVPFDPSFAPLTTFCAGKLNSQGCVPVIGAIGSASATSANPFLVTAANEVTNKPGLLLLGFASSSQPFQGGTLCIAGPIKRLGGQRSGGSTPCSGTYAFDMQAHIQSGSQPGLTAGAVAYCQWWNRDPLDPAGFSSGLSNGLLFAIAP
ncbi:MAG TPA: right-handed parallel beta-helix repeat-containing protein [Planctomycetota bacterium]|nr:right-handed parallel beta-helix repeat-containing protein [Planctomycetota bacterium]